MNVKCPHRSVCLNSWSSNGGVILEALAALGCGSQLADMGFPPLATRTGPLSSLLHETISQHKKPSSLKFWYLVSETSKATHTEGKSFIKTQSPLFQSLVNSVSSLQLFLQGTLSLLARSGAPGCTTEAAPGNTEEGEASVPC